MYSSALDRITKSAVPDLPVAEINKVIHTAHRRMLYNPQAYEDLAPLSVEQLDVLFAFLFPDSSKDAAYKYPSLFDQNSEFQKDHVVLAFVSITS